MNDTEALAALSSISSATRLRILKMLVAAGPDGLGAGDIATQVGATPSRASFHLSNMAEAGLVAFERSARHVTYRVDFETVGGLVRYLVEDCCKNAPSVRRCCS